MLKPIIYTSQEYITKVIVTFVQMIQVLSMQTIYRCQCDMINILNITTY